ncbi:hypothetical protein D1AOALGA4SA_7514 [Olavius algarvensis Delta 1 endosymbiont]|nr:hypothetical protein D1AOALGA4SA_7514 [Olavius algarvensis Delta 1 endosymbiont]
MRRLCSLNGEQMTSTKEQITNNTQIPISNDPNRLDLFQ